MSDSIESLEVTPDEAAAAAAELEGNAPPAQEAPLLAGKYKTPQELEAAYEALQTKLGNNEPPKLELKPAEAGEGDLNMERIGELAELYQSGDEGKSQVYAQLAQLGIGRDVADNFMDMGRSLAEARDAALVQSVGGPEAFQAMSQWASEAYSVAEMEAFNAAVNHADANIARMAMQALEARYKASNATTAELMTGNAARPGVTGFRSNAEVLEAMKDPRYERDPAYRADIEAKLAASTGVLNVQMGKDGH